MNVILIVNDSFRRDHLGVYGNDSIHTPNLDAFAAESAVFDRYYAASYPTVPNRWDIVTGRYGFPFRGWQPLGPADRTMAQLAGAAGIHTQMIWDTPMLGFHEYDYTRGFDGHYFVHGQKGDPWITNPSLDIELPCAPHKILSIPSFLSYLRNHHGRQYEREFCVGRSVSAACDWLETNHNHDGFLLWLDMWDPHEPFDCPWYDLERYLDPGYSGEQLIYPEYGRHTYMSAPELANARARYAGNVTMVDRWMGTLFRTLEKLRLNESTLVIWTTDHGHLFGEHDLQGKPGAQLGNLYETTAHIPLLVRHPEGLGADKRVSGICQPPDILPSVLEFLNIPIPDGIDGTSFWPLVENPDSAGRTHAFSSRFPRSDGADPYIPNDDSVFDGWKGTGGIVEASTVTTCDWAYICSPADRRSELYDLRDDPAQVVNLIGAAGDNGSTANELRSIWIDFLRDSGAADERIRPFADPAPPSRMSEDGELFVFRDDSGCAFGFATAESALKKCSHPLYQSDPPRIARSTFGALADEDPRNLIFLFGQYYWATDLL